MSLLIPPLCFSAPLVEAPYNTLSQAQRHGRTGRQEYLRYRSPRFETRRANETPIRGDGVGPGGANQAAASWFHRLTRRGKNLSHLHRVAVGPNAFYLYRVVTRKITDCCVAEQTHHLRQDARESTMMTRGPSWTVRDNTIRDTNTASGKREAFESIVFIASKAHIKRNMFSHANRIETKRDSS